MQVWLAGYEWWQILAGAILVVVFVMAYFQVTSRYSSGDIGRHGSRAPTGAGGAFPRHGASRDDVDDAPYHPYQDEAEDFHRNRNHGHGQQRQYDRQNDAYDDYGGGGQGHGDGGYFSGGGGGGGGNNNQMWTLMALGGVGFLCYKGIIPVHRMNWFQLYMLWNMLSPLLLGGRGGMGGYGRRRRGFF